MAQLTKSQLPFWLKYANKITIFLNKKGLTVGSQHILTTTGRKSGKLRSTPVSILIVKGDRYICTLIGNTDWVKNVRVNPNATLQRGKKIEAVQLTEVNENKRGTVMREFPVQVSVGKRLGKIVLGISGTPESFEKAAHMCRVFRIN